MQLENPADTISQRLEEFDKGFVPTTHGSGGAMLLSREVINQKRELEGQSKREKGEGDG